LTTSQCVVTSTADQSVAACKASQDADTLTGGTGNDTFVFAANSATSGVAQVSGANLTDTITDFVSGTDKLSLAQATSFLGNYANLTSGLAATAGSGVGTNQAFYSLADNIVYVIASATGVLASTDTMVKLSNAPATISSADLNFGAVGGASIVLTAVSQSVTATSTTPAASTTFNDTITGTIANVQGATTLVGGTGTDSVILSDAGTFASPVVFNSIETLVLAAGTNTVTLQAGTTNSALKNITGGSGNDAITVTNIVAGGAISLGDGADSLAAMTTVIGQTAGATFDGGANGTGTVDTVTFAASTMIATSLDQFSNFESVDFGPLANSTAHVVTLPTTNALTTIAATFGTAANVLNITGTSAQIDALTSVTQAGAFAGGIILNVSNAASITFASTDTTASTATADGGINIVLGNFTNTLTVDSAKMTGVNTGTVTLDTITGGTGTDTINITGTNSTVATQVNFTTGFENYNFTGTGATTVTPVVGAMVTGTTNFNASTVIGTTTFTFDGSAGTAAKKIECYRWCFVYLFQRHNWWCWRRYIDRRIGI